MPQVKFTERRTVQNPLLKYAVEAGWESRRGIIFRFIVETENKNQIYKK